MGSETTKALMARRRKASARAVRLIEEAEERNPIEAARRARINSAVRDGLRAVKALGAAERALADLHERAGAALIGLTADGFSRSQAYELLGLSRAVGRRLFNVAGSTRRAPDGLSTAASVVSSLGASHDDADNGAPNGATTEGIL